MRVLHPVRFIACLEQDLEQRSHGFRDALVWPLPVMEEHNGSLRFGVLDGKSCFGRERLFGLGHVVSDKMSIVVANSFEGKGMTLDGHRTRAFGLEVDPVHTERLGFALLRKQHRVPRRAFPANDFAREDLPQEKDGQDDHRSRADSPEEILTHRTVPLRKGEWNVKEH